jgi:hypothetical protein
LGLNSRFQIDVIALIELLVILITERVPEDSVQADIEVVEFIG